MGTASHIYHKGNIIWGLGYTGDKGAEGQTWEGEVTQSSAEGCCHCEAGETKGRGGVQGQGHHEPLQS